MSLSAVTRCLLLVDAEGDRSVQCHAPVRVLLQRRGHWAARKRCDALARANQCASASSPCGTQPSPRAQGAAHMGHRVRQDEWLITLHRTVISALVPITSLNLKLMRCPACGMERKCSKCRVVRSVGSGRAQPPPIPR